MMLISPNTVCPSNCAFPPSFFPSVGSVLGFGLVYGGADAITWNEAKDEVSLETFQQVRLNKSAKLEPC